MKEKRNQLLLITTFVLTQIVAVLFTQNFIISQIPVEQYAPFGNENVAQASANSGILVIYVALFTIFLIFILKYRLRVVFKFIVIILPLIFLFGFTDWQLMVLLNRYSGTDLFTLSTSITLLFILAIVYGLYNKNYLIVTSSVLLLTTEIASYLALSLSPPTLYILPLAFALYDIYAVFRGPLKKLIKIQPKKTLQEKFIYSDLGLIITRIGGFTIGTGDFVFYSLLVASGFIQKSFLGAAIVGIAINLGVLLTLYILEKYNKPLPGLPIPIFLAVGILLLLPYV
ncbi:MAG: hypothetical protein J4452_01850 [Candidatus Aenigmarchaeota archaeon]|nr:hypothetical protein [Candidatus Aenigmarchaeota archaeon]